MNMDKFTVKMQEAVQSAHELAMNSGHQEINAGHVLLALLKQGEGVARPLFEKLGVSADTLADLGINPESSCYHGAGCDD